MPDAAASPLQSLPGARMLNGALLTAKIRKAASSEALYKFIGETHSNDLQDAPRRSHSGAWNGLGARGGYGGRDVETESREIDVLSGTCTKEPDSDLR